MILRCCGLCHEDELSAVESGVYRFTAESGVQVETEWYSDLSDLHRRLSTMPGQIVFVAYPGAVGMEAITRARELLPKAPLVWFSDEKGFCLHSYRLRTADFALLPASEEKVMKALERCIPLHIAQVKGCLAE